MEICPSVEFWSAPIVVSGGSYRRSTDLLSVALFRSSDWSYNCACAPAEASCGGRNRMPPDAEASSFTITNQPTLCGSNSDWARFKGTQQRRYFLLINQADLVHSPNAVLLVLNVAPAWQGSFLTGRLVRLSAFLTGNDQSGSQKPFTPRP